MNIIITGASKGIGYHAAIAFAKEPGNIIVIARDGDALNQLRKHCRVSGLKGRIFPIASDLMRDDMEETLARRIRSVFDEADILVNNAGFLVNKPFDKITAEDFDSMFTVNVKSVFRLCQIVAPMMKQGSHILNISSMGGFQGSAKFPGLSIYSASKGAVAVLTECLAEELKPQGISVNCLALGAIDTEMLREAFPGYQAPVSAEKMGNFVENFARHGHKYMNGKIIPVALSTP